MKFRDFLDVSWFPKILSLKLLGNLRGNSCMPCLLVIITLPFTCGERKTCSNIKKSRKGQRCTM